MFHTWKGPRPVANGFRRHDMEQSRDGGTDASSTGNGCQRNDVVGKIRWGAAMNALEQQNSDFEVDPLANEKPVEVTQDRCKIW